MMKRFMVKAILFPLLLSCFYACAVKHSPVYVKNGKKYGVVSGNFTDRWYDYYERGVSYKNGNFFKEALSDLNIAILSKQKDQRWVNTYGMHFIDYFPHREKGIIHFLLGDYKSSEEELTISMKQAPSAKASHFLDQTRIRRMLKENRVAIPPVIQLHYPKRTQDEIITVSGSAEDDCYVSTIFISGEKIPMAASSKILPIYHQVTLSEGENHIEIVARNLLGAETQKRIRIYRDQSGPTIVIKEHIPGVRLSGYLTDRSVIKSFQVDGTEYIETLKNGCFHLDLTERSGSILLTASDDLGNTTRLTLNGDINLPKTRARLPFFITNGCLAEGSPSANRPIKIPSDIDIRIKDLCHECVVYQKNISLKAEIKSDSPINSIIIHLQGGPLTITLDGQNGHLSPSGAVISFNQSIPVSEGENLLRIMVTTASGDTGSLDMTIIRKIHEVLKPEHRFAVRLTQLDHPSGKEEPSLFQRILGHSIPFSESTAHLEENKKKRFHDALEIDFKKRRRFQILSSEKDTLKTEARLKGVSRVFPKKNLPLKPDGLLMGNSCVDPWGTEVTMRLISLVTFEEIIAVDHFSLREEKEDVKKMALDLSERFHLALPLSEGKVTAILADKVLIKCSNGIIKEGWPVYIYKECATTPDGCSPSCNENDDAAIFGLFTMGSNQSVDLKNSTLNVEKGDRVIAR